MATLKFSGVGIKAVAACVPRNISNNKDLGYLIPQDEIEKTINLIGIKEKRIADADVCASDLCFKAAERLIEDNHIDRSTIDMVLFLSQTPDYKIPATAPILQQRLGLPQSTAAMDLSLACSGYVYALSTAFAYASTQGVDRILLLVGETFSKIVNTHDKVNFPLYGDAGTATLIEKGDFGGSTFTLYTDGSGAEAVMIEAGECRHPTNSNNIMAVEVEDGNVRSPHEVYMDGMAVFNFALSVVPKSIKEIATINNIDVSDVSTIVLHQANKFMTDFFVKKLKFDPSRVPYCLDRYGNTSSASIPLTISSEMASNNYDKSRVVLCGFGAGLSWGTAMLNMTGCNISPLIEY